jgi:glycosyltransferase involved in cell wall biosynthesis
MNNRPKVSVIIAAYNHEDYITATLESIEQQTFQDFEIILIDDGSADKTVLNARAVHSRANIIVQHNQGVVAARNRGIAMAQGEYLCFIDSDDIILPNRFEKQVSLLESDRELGLVFADAFIIDAGGNRIGKFSDVYPLVSGDIAEALILNYCFIPMITVMVRAEILKKIGLFEKPGPTSDYIKWIEIAYRSKVAYDSEPLGCWRRHVSNVSKMADKEKSYAQTRVAIHRLLRRYPELRAKVETLVNHRFSKSYFLTGFFLAAAGKLPQARKNYWKAVKVYPWSVANWAAIAFVCLLPEKLVIKIHQSVKAKKLPW